MISERCSYFYGVQGIPNGGLRLAKCLEKYINPEGKYYLIVDDVCTTGKSLTEYRADLGSPDYVVGFVVFARDPKNLPAWCAALWYGDLI